MVLERSRECSLSNSMVSKPWIHPGVCNVWVKVLNSNLSFEAMSKNAVSHVVSTSRVARLVYFNPNCSILYYFRVVWIMIFRLDFFSLAVSLDKFKRNMENPSSVHIIIKRQSDRKKRRRGHVYVHLEGRLDPAAAATTTTITTATKPTTVTIETSRQYCTGHCGHYH